MTEAILEEKRKRRLHERLWRKTRLTVHKLAYKDCCEKVKNMIQGAKASYFRGKIDACEGDQKKLFQIVNNLLGRGKSTELPEFSSPHILANIFNEYFVTKITDIRNSFVDLETTTKDLMCPPICSLLSPSRTKLDKFTPASCTEILKIVKGSSKATCSLDPIPTSLLHDVLLELTPAITAIVNSCFNSGVFPLGLKSAIVRPLLKKPSLDADTLKNYRPVSNLPFLSKVIEKVIASRLLDHLEANNLMDPMQSAYRKGHSTETALLRIHNDLVSAVDRGHGVCLILLDLSAAFDTVDHTIFLTFLEDYIGLKGAALAVFQSYLCGRTQCVSIEGVFSELTELMFGVPQGSVLGPIAFCMYTIPVGAILRHYNIKYHIYADDTQIYISFELDSLKEAIELLSNCISDIRTWMIRNKLKINDDKTEFLIISSTKANIPTGTTIQIGHSKIPQSLSCKSLGVTLDTNLFMDKHIKNVCRSAFYHLRNISAIRHLLPTSSAENLIHSLVTARLDYCNSLLVGVPECRLKQLQRVQNVAARILSMSPKGTHVSPILVSLHWLPIRERILFKILLLTFKCLSNSAPSYLQELVTRQQHTRSLRSNSQQLLTVPKIRLKSYGERSFQFVAAIEWNKLPLSIKECSSVSVFKTRLKTYLFERRFREVF